MEWIVRKQEQLRRIGIVETEQKKILIKADVIIYYVLLSELVI